MNENKLEENKTYIFKEKYTSYPTIMKVKVMEVTETTYYLHNLDADTRFRSGKNIFEKYEITEEVLPVSEPVPERIEISQLSAHDYINKDIKYNDGYWYQFKSTAVLFHFPNSKIISAIESALNNDIVVEDKSQIMAESGKGFLHIWIEKPLTGEIKINGTKVYLESEVDAIRNEAFADGVKIGSGEQPTNDNTFVWDDKLACEWGGYLEEKMKFCSTSEIPRILKEWKQSKLSTPVAEPLPTNQDNDLIEISYKRFSNGEMKPENTFMLIPADIFEETKNAINDVFIKHYPAVKKRPIPEPSQTPPPASKPVLFTTDDNVNIYEDGLGIWRVFTGVHSFPSWEPINLGIPLNKVEGEKYFSTKEVAEQFCLENKPCLSLNDVKMCYAHDRSFVGTQWLEQNLKEKVQQKLSNLNH